jgi:hypothetical protein
MPEIQVCWVVIETDLSINNDIAALFRRLGQRSPHFDNNPHKPLGLAPFALYVTCAGID